MGLIAAQAARVANIRTLLALTMVLGVLGMQSGRGTLGYFTSTATSTGNTFVAGTVTIDLDDPSETTGRDVTASIGGSNLQPGTTIVGTITAKSTGSLPLHYGLRYTATNAASGAAISGSTTPLIGRTNSGLAAGTTDITLRVFVATATGDCTVSNVDGTRTNLTLVYGTSATAGVNLIAGTQTILIDSGSTTAGTNPAPRRALNASGGSAPTSEILCFAVNWPIGSAGAENNQQGGAATIGFDFDARQQ